MDVPNINDTILDVVCVLMKVALSTKSVGVEPSIGGLINGNALKGGLIVIKFEVDNASNFVFLSEVSIKYISSQLTNK